MRITNGFFSNTMLYALRRSNGQVGDLMTQINTGMRVQRPSDDPIAAVRLLMIDRDQGMLDQYRSNISSLSIRLQQNETRLDGMLGNVSAAYDLMVWAADGSNTPDDLNAMAASVESLRDNLLSEVNATDAEGNYQFSGTRTDTPAISYDPAAPLGQRYSYTGNTDKQQVTVGQGMIETANVTADDMAGLFNQLDQALNVLQDPDADVSDPATRAILTDCLDAMDQGIGLLSGKIAGLGSAQKMLDQMDQSHAAMQVSNGQAAELVGGLDSQLGGHQAHQRRLIRRCYDHHRAAQTFRSECMFDELAHLAAAFADQANYHHVCLGLPRDHAKQHALADAAAGEQAHALAAAQAQHAVDGTHAHIQHADDGLLLHRIDARRMQIQRTLARQGAQSVERTAQPIDDASVPGRSDLQAAIVRIGDDAGTGDQPGRFAEGHQIRHLVTEAHHARVQPVAGGGFDACRLAGLERITSGLQQDARRTAEPAHFAGDRDLVQLERAR